MLARRAMPRRRHDGDTEEVERLAPASPAPGMTPAHLLALQRSGVGNRLLAREFGDVVIEDVEEEEEEEDAGGVEQAEDGTRPPLLLLTDRPWAEIEAARAAPAYEPMEPEAPEEEETAAAETPAEAPAAKKKKRKKKKKGKGGGAEQTEAAEAQAEEPAAPPPKPVAAEPPVSALSIEEQLAFIGEKPAAPKKQKKQTAPKVNKQQEEARKRKQAAEQAEADDEKLKRQEEQKKKAQEETDKKKILKQALDIRLIDVQAARDAKPNDLAHRDIRKEADDEAKTLDAWLKAKDFANTSSSQRQAKLDSVNKVILKVEGFQPPETPLQKRLRKFNEVKTNVTLKLGEAEWQGAYGGQTDFSVDKYDPDMRALIEGHYGWDAVEVPNHADKKYPGKTKTSKVYYYVTQTSHTEGVAYDISLHPWDGNKKLPTVHVLHIPHKDS